jgi:hypothetical protein
MGARRRISRVRVLARGALARWMSRLVKIGAEGEGPAPEVIENDRRQVERHGSRTTDGPPRSWTTIDLDLRIHMAATTRDRSTAALRVRSTGCEPPRTPILMSRTVLSAQEPASP